MESAHLLEVDECVLELVVKLLNYSSMDSFNEDVRKVKEWIKKQPHFPEVMGQYTTATKTITALNLNS